MRFNYSKTSGFTLAELLIALAVLGVIATFTIPKVLNGSQNGQKNAMAKEVASMMSGALQAYRLENSVVGAGINEFTPFMNYVRVDTSGTAVDHANTGGSLPCSGPYKCLVLHNGGRLAYHADSGVKYTVDAPNYGVYAFFDADGEYGGSATGPSKSVVFYIYANGRITTLENLIPNTLVGGTPVAATPNTDPEWFSW